MRASSERLRNTASRTASPRGGCTPLATLPATTPSVTAVLSAPESSAWTFFLVLAAPAKPLSQAATSRRVRVSTGTAPRTGLMCRAAMRR